MSDVDNARDDDVGSDVNLNQCFHSGNVDTRDEAEVQQQVRWAVGSSSKDVKTVFFRPRVITVSDGSGGAMAVVTGGDGGGGVEWWW